MRLATTCRPGDKMRPYHCVPDDSLRCSRRRNSAIRFRCPARRPTQNPAVARFVPPDPELASTDKLRRRGIAFRERVSSMSLRISAVPLDSMASESALERGSDRVSDFIEEPASVRGRSSFARLRMFSLNREMAPAFPRSFTRIFSRAILLFASWISSAAASCNLPKVVVHPFVNEISPGFAFFFKAGQTKTIGRFRMGALF